MASTFLRKTSRNIGTGATQIGAYVVGAATQTTVIGLSVSNITGAGINITVTHSDGSNTTNLVKSAPVPVGGSLIIVGGDQKIVMQTGDSISVLSDTAASADAYMSVLEIT